MKARDVISQLGSRDASEVVASLDRCVIGEREMTAVVVAHLVVLERESIHLDMGYSSLFAYCNERLGYSRDCALKRMRAATAATFHPEILDDLESGTLTLSSILPLAPHLTGGQVGTELLEAARGKSRRQIEALVAARFPDRKSPRGDMRIKAVGDGLVRFSMVVGTELIDKLEAARDIDRHRNPEGDVEKILSEALDRFVAGVEKRKHKVTERPRPAPEAPTKSVPAAVRRAVHQRDGGRCTFEGTERVCGERAFVEHDHVEPRARGGEHSEDNGAQLCASHNRRKAELQIGTEAVARGRRRAETERDLLAAMVGLGFRRAEARERTMAALDRHGPDAELETLCRAALE